MKILKRALLVLLLVVIVAAVGFVIWGSTPLGPMPQAKLAMVSDDQVKVSTDKWMVFQPTAQAKKTGLIFYPGGRVDPVSYAPAAHAIAAQGYPVVIVPMPLNLAVFGSNRASDVIAAFPQIEHWVIGGHSLGGAMAAAFADTHPDAVDGLALWAAYPPNNNSLAESNTEVVSISGTKDGLSTPAKIDASRALLPADTAWEPIQGGNHGQFGWYGDQPGDGQATISREEQQSEIVRDTTALLGSVLTAK